MEQIRNDSWSLGATPTITSYFKLIIDDGHSPNLGKGPISTGKCGLGWKYIFQATEHEPFLAGRGAVGKQTEFAISFAPHLVSKEDLGKLSVTIVVEGGVLLDKARDPTTEFSLPRSDIVHLGLCHSTQNFTGNATVEIKVRLSPSFTLAPDPSQVFAPKLQRALADSLIGRGIGDVKFCLFSRHRIRQHEGHDVTHPEILYANSFLLLGHCEYLDQVLSEPGNDTNEVEIIDDPTKLEYDVYDYEADSDLEPESDGEDSEDYSDVEDSSTRTTARRRSFRDDENAILIRQTAFKTWKALMIYLYSKEIQFQPLTSNGSGWTEASASNDATTCSPKSMYRLAKKIGYEELQALSLQAIIRGLSEDNIVEELFSRFTSMFPEVQKAGVEHLMTFLTNKGVVHALLNKIMSVTATGESPHCGSIVARIMQSVIIIANSPVTANRRPPK